jgi:hypothetical protein
MDKRLSEIAERLGVDPDDPAVLRDLEAIRGSDPAVPHAEKTEVGDPTNRRLGVGLASAGAALLLIAVFLPMADSSRFAHVGGNSLIQHAQGWIAVVVAVGTAVLAYQSLAGRVRSRALMLIGLAVIILAVLWGTSDDLLTLTSSAPTEGLGLQETLEVMSFEEKASPGIGIYAVGVAGLLIGAGGAMLRRPKN